MPFAQRQPEHAVSASEPGTTEGIGPAPASPGREDDFHGWAQAQTAALAAMARDGRLVGTGIDAGGLEAELARMSRYMARGCEQMAIEAMAMLACLDLMPTVAKAPYWGERLEQIRGRLAGLMSPSLRRALEADEPRLRKLARYKAAIELAKAAGLADPSPFSAGIAVPGLVRALAPDGAASGDPRS
jgi:hypothetical protein